MYDYGGGGMNDWDNGGSFNYWYNGGSMHGHHGGCSDYWDNGGSFDDWNYWGGMYGHCGGWMSHNGAVASDGGRMGDYWSSYKAGGGSSVSQSGGNNYELNKKN